MSSHAHAHSDRNVIHLDLSSQKLLLKPDDPIPEFYPPPRAVMVTPIYNDADAYGQQPPGAGGSERGYRNLRNSGRRYLDDEYDDYDRGRRSRSGGRRGGSSSPSYRGRYSDDGYDYSGRGGGYREDDDEFGDRKRSRVPGTEPPLLPPPDISHYPGGSTAGAGGYRHTHGQGHGHAHGNGHGHGRAQSHSYGRYDRDYGRYDRPHHQGHKPREGPSRDAYAHSSGFGRRDRGGREGYNDDEDYPPTHDYGSDEYSPDNGHPDDDPYISYTGDAGRVGYTKRSRPAGTEPPKLPPPDISAYPGGGGGSHGVQGVPGVHEGAGPPPGSGASGSGGHGYAGSQSQHPASQHPASQQGHGYAGSTQYSHQQHQQHPQRHGKKPGLIGRIFSRSAGTHKS